jgi:hypothetical protein
VIYIYIYIYIYIHGVSSAGGRQLCLHTSYIHIHGVSSAGGQELRLHSTHFLLVSGIAMVIKSKHATPTFTSDRVPSLHVFNLQNGTISLREPKSTTSLPEPSVWLPDNVTLSKYNCIIYVVTVRTRINPKEKDKR